MDSSLFTLRRIWILLGLMGVWLLILNALLAQWISERVHIDPLIYIVLTGGLCLWFLLVCRTRADHLLVMMGFVALVFLTEFIETWLSYHPFDWMSAFFRFFSVLVVGVLPVRSLALHKRLVR